MSQHAWMINHFISLIDYCEKNKLPQVEAALVDTIESIAPMIAAPRAPKVRRTALVLPFPTAAGPTGGTTGRQTGTV